jgi:hypothetical protein
VTIWSFGRCAVGIFAAAALLAGCGGSQPPINASGATPQSRAIATHVKPAGSCPYYYECITLKYGSPFEQEWCVTGPPAGLGFGPSCVPISYGTWQWSTRVKGFGRWHSSAKKIAVSVYPNPGNPTELTISETKKIKPSSGKIVLEVDLHPCTKFLGGIECVCLHSCPIGISTSSPATSPAPSIQTRFEFLLAARRDGGSAVFRLRSGVRIQGCAQGSDQG